MRPSSQSQKALEVQITASRAPRVLLAEDDGPMRQLLADSLTRRGFDVIQAADGIDFLERLGSATEPIDGGPVDLVITDIRMPSLDGYQAMAALRYFDAATPVIVISAFADDEIRAEAYRLGAVAVLDKPFDLELLLGTAQRLVGSV